MSSVNIHELNINDEGMIKQMISKLIEMKNYVILKKLFSINETAKMMNPKELNKLFQVDGYRFTRNHNRTIFQVNYYLKKKKDSKKMQYIKE